jgi:hypothetical protein
VPAHRDRAGRKKREDAHDCDALEGEGRCLHEPAVVMGGKGCVLGGERSCNAGGGEGLAAKKRRTNCGKRVVRGAGGVVGDSREIEERQISSWSACTWSLRRGGGFMEREGVRVMAGFAAGEAERRVAFAGGGSLHCPLNS